MEKCENCNGKGMVVLIKEEKGRKKAVFKLCEKCKGNGYV